jgi:hypothetical protein
VKKITTFKSVEIEGDFRSRKTVLWPNSLGMDILPFDVDDFEYTVGEEFSKGG